MTQSTDKKSNGNEWFLQGCQAIDQEQLSKAKQYQTTLTKPAGSLGQLEDIATRFAAWQQQLKPVLDTLLIRVFAGDHGICAQGVSAFPQHVTAQMIDNFLSGGAAISVLNKALSKQFTTDFSVVNMGTVEPLTNIDSPIYHNIQLANGTNDFTQQPAMSEQTVLAALDAGQQQILTAKQKPQLFIGGEMGIGNTTSAAAIYSLVLDLPPETTVGPGTGVNKDGMARKCKVLYQGFNQHAEYCQTPLDILQHFGGLEIAALSGSFIACAQQGIPVLVDGFIATAAALIATKLNNGVSDWLIFAHKSAEPAHKLALEFFKQSPLLDLGLRLGEGSGAAVAVPLINTALQLHTQMATFEQAGVSE